jgi:peptide methionine sulfoxide reductase MsrA
MGGSGCCPTYSNYTANNNYSETLRLVFDGVDTTYADLLAAYWQFVPDPTYPCDDPAYCPNIFYVDESQRTAAAASIAAQSKKANATLLVGLLPASSFQFWKAEEYHQNFFSKSGCSCADAHHGNPMCLTEGTRNTQADKLLQHSV